MPEPSSKALGPDLQRFDSVDADEKRARLEESIHRRRALLDEYARLVEHLRLRAAQSEFDRGLYSRALSELSIDELTHLDVVDVARIQREPLTHADSFFRSIVIRRRKKQLGSVPEKYLGIDKERDQLFGEIAGLRTPTTHFVGRFEDIPDELRAGVILKPVRSAESKGAFYVFGEADIFGIQDSRRLRGWSELRDAIHVEFGDDAEDTIWQVQELVYGNDGAPARDLKFYSFYGRIGLILEVCRYPERQYAFFDEDLSEAACGREHHPRFRDRSLTTADKGGLTEEKLSLVKWLSQELPVPFMRIDFLDAGSEIVFCEFSSAPGLSHTLNETYDRLLGSYYHDAENRLVSDLLMGKRFEVFRDFAARIGPTRAGAERT